MVSWRLKDINDFVNIFKKHGIELIAYGGTNLQLVRDKKINSKSINFIINCNKYLTKLLPDSKGQLKNKSYFNKDLMSDLEKIGWIARKGALDFYKSKFPVRTSYTKCMFGIKFHSKGRIVDIWPFMKVYGENYFGLRSGDYIHKSYIENLILFDNSYNILIPKYSEKLLGFMYENWRIPSKSPSTIKKDIFENTFKLIDENGGKVRYEERQLNISGRDEFYNFKCN